MFVVRTERCIECGDVFTIPLNEFIWKLDNGMKLPKRCRCCREKRRRHPDPFQGTRQVMYQYPATKGHRHTVHGGAL